MLLNIQASGKYTLVLPGNETLGPEVRILGAVFLKLSGNIYIFYWMRRVVLKTIDFGQAKLSFIANISSSSLRDFGQFT